jgi:uncharacterized protein YggE
MNLWDPWPTESSRKILMRNSILWVFLFPLALHADPEIKGSPAELASYLKSVPRTVVISGESEVKVQADRAIISLKVTTESKSLNDALKANQDVRARATKTLKDRGIPPERVEASKFSSTPKFGLFGDKAKSYRVDNFIKVAVLEEREFQAVAGVVDNTAEVQYLGVDFEHTDQEKLKKLALRQALDDAAARGKIYEDSLEIRLVPIGFSGNAATAPIPIPVGDTVESVASPGRIARPKSMTPIPADGFQPDLGESTSLFGELKFIGRVAVQYAVEAK